MTIALSYSIKSFREAKEKYSSLPLFSVIILSLMIVSTYQVIFQYNVPFWSKGLNSFTVQVNSFENRNFEIGLSIIHELILNTAGYVYYPMIIGLFNALIFSFFLITFCSWLKKLNKDYMKPLFLTLALSPLYFFFFLTLNEEMIVSYFVLSFFIIFIEFFHLENYKLSNLFFLFLLFFVIASLKFIVALWLIFFVLIYLLMSHYKLNIISIFTVFTVFVSIVHFPLYDLDFLRYLFPFWICYPALIEALK